MPQENTMRDDVLAALAQTAALADVVSPEPGVGLPTAELQALVDGHEYAGHRIPPYVRLLTYAPGEEIVREGEVGDDRFFFVVAGLAEVYVRRGYAKVGELQPGTLFGEMAVLNNLPRSATVSATKETETVVLEIQRPALRWLRKVPSFAAALDKAYRRNSRAVALQDVGAATRLDTEALNKLATISQFRVYEPGHQLFGQGEPVRRLYILMRGWVQLSQDKPTQEETLASDVLSDASHWEQMAGADYLGAGYCFGLEGLATELPWPQTGILLARSEVLEISVSLLREAGDLLEDISTCLKKLAPPVDLARQPQPLPIANAQKTLIQTGVANTANLLAIDAHTCTRCGNCSLTCHTIHGQTRLVRRGFTVPRPVTLTPRAATQPLIVPSACHHCRQPECLAGCPVNAISQLPDGRVELNMQSCIGCGDCATLCPYDAITLVPREAVSSEAVPSETAPNEAAPATEPGALVALKCDLCAGASCNPQPGPPRVYGCEENCPTGALRRVVPSLQFEELHAIEQPRLRRVRAKKKDQTQARNAARQADQTEWRLHLLGGTLNLLLVALVALRLQNDAPLFGTARAWHWVTGGLGLLGLAGTWAYAWRKRQRSGRYGALRYWLLAHNYSALAMGLLFMSHSGKQFASPLTKGLGVALAVALLSGLLGQLLNLVLPRWLTAREAQPWLLEDLLARRAELQTAEAGQPAAATTLRQLNQMIWLQRLLRGWVWPHAVGTVVFVVLLLLHLWQVVFFRWR